LFKREIRESFLLAKLCCFTVTVVLQCCDTVGWVIWRV